MKKNFITDFILCGIFGWCMECLSTGFHSIRTHTDKKLTCTTSMWMFPIYGMAAAIGPISRVLSNLNIIVRGIIYACGIFSVEYLAGSLLKRHGCCPWDYSKAKLNYKGLIRFDYFPAWFFAGLCFEKIVNRK